MAASVGLEEPDGPGSGIRNRLTGPFWPVAPRYRTAVALAVALAFLLRVVRIADLFGVLVDEAIYMRWAEIIRHRHNWFVSLLDAKPPLAYWLYAAMRTAVPSDPLLADRLISLGAGTACTLLLYRLGYLCGGRLAGVILAFAYAVLPFGVFYDHIGYVDSLVNLFGVLLVLAALSCFGGSGLSWRRTFFTGFIFGAALFTKTTILLFGFVPLTIAVYLQKRLSRALAAHVATIYAVAALFTLFTHFAVPPGPAPAINNLIFHHTSFFTPAAALLQDPLANWRVNAPQLAEYAARYITPPGLMAAGAALVVLLAARQFLAVVIAFATILPFAFTVFTLEYFPSRYAFPHVWPVLLVLACGASVLLRRNTPMRWFAACALAIALGSMSLRSARLLMSPELVLASGDADEFLGSGPYSGEGVREAIAFLRAESDGGPMTILTDPWWGPPADAVFAFLNGVEGIEVYEAWWLQLEGTYPLVPAGAMPVWQSQYERVWAGSVNFENIQRLYYVTDTNYHDAGSVQRLDGNARLVRRFPKRSGQESIDVYRLGPFDAAAAAR